MNIDPPTRSDPRRATWRLACLLALWPAACVSAQTSGEAPPPTTTPAAAPLVMHTRPDPPAPKLDAATRDALAWQIALDRAGFSPGLIDGKPGAKSRLAATQLQLARKLPATGKFDAATAAALGDLLPATADVVALYTVAQTDRDAVTGVSKDWIERSQMKSLGYDTLTDALAERFQTTQAFLRTLNPRLDIDALQPGDRLHVPAVEGERPTRNKPASLEVNLTRKTVRLLDAEGQPLGLLHCSIAADVAKRPSGEASVTTVAFDPNYTFNPELYPEVKNVTTRLIIPPGPRNPVGVAWIGLSLPGYGMHGTPWPELIGKTGSHGCIRLANWDARRLAKVVKIGMPVRFVTD